MTIVYFVRHAKPNLSVHDDLTRPLTKSGVEASQLVTKFLRDKEIDQVFSSPFKRAIDTVKHFAEDRQMPVKVIDDFRERKISDHWIEDFNSFTKRQWEDFDYKLPAGDSLNEVQERNIVALKILLRDYQGEKLVIGTHGTSLSTIMNYFDSSFDYEFFDRIRGYMPFVMRLGFVGEELVDVEEFLI